MNNNNFLKIPVFNKDDIFVSFDRSIFKKLNGMSELKYLSVVMYVRKNCNISGEVRTSLHNLARGCGYDIVSHNKNAFSDFRMIIKKYLIDTGYMLCDSDIDTITPSKTFKLTLVNDIDVPESNSFVMMTVSEFDRIVSLNTNINNAVLVGVYLYIKQYIISDNDLYSPISCPSKNKISTTLGLSSSTVYKAIDVLVKNKILYESDNYYIKDSKDNDIFICIRHAYALNQKHLTDAAIKDSLYCMYNETIYSWKDVKKINGKIKSSEKNNSN